MMNFLTTRSELKSGMEIFIIPIGEIAPCILNDLLSRLEKYFHVPVQSIEPIRIPISAYNSDRNQYNAELILEFLIKEKAEQKYCLGIVDADLYVPQMNFVFGVADTVSGIALISTKRLKTDFYGLAPADKTMLRRILIESVHELGHVFGLIHCPNSLCVMHFSNSIFETDIKGPDFCSNCRNILNIRWINSPAKRK